MRLKETQRELYASRLGDPGRPTCEGNGNRSIGGFAIVLTVGIPYGVANALATKDAMSLLRMNEFEN